MYVFYRDITKWYSDFYVKSILNGWENYCCILLFKKSMFWTSNQKFHLNFKFNTAIISNFKIKNIFVDINYSIKFSRQTVCPLVIIYTSHKAVIQLTKSKFYYFLYKNTHNLRNFFVVHVLFIKTIQNEINGNKKQSKLRIRNKYCCINKF